ncbi:hypothetical protein HPP92_010273 [Vanilla planifolia]|uniref:RING-type E3 ubiquitin transferase n=1 Tax=Vanilla planifolia TaxID=51239 RepID=A0A835R4U3_VANPL|nr:hypothetical protein HPP92_010273 [Vanilla planifolia]
MGLLRDRWKISFRRSSFSSSSSLPPPSPPQPTANPDPPDPPPEFLCPISGTLMADPVIVPSGETYERACIEACRDLTVSPPSLSLDISSSFLLIPNSALRSAIIRWCDVAGVPLPLPLSSSDAIRIIRRCLPSSNPKSHTSCSTELPTSSSSSSHSSHSSDEIIAAVDRSNETLESKSPEKAHPITASVADPLEEEIVAKLKRAQIQEQESALASLLEATRESSERRVLLCSPRLLGSLRSLLSSRQAAVKSAALAVIVNLSLELPNKVRIIRSGVIPAIVNSLHPSAPVEARENAAGVLFSLALDEQNRTALGVLGAVPPLLRIFCAAEEGLRARLESGMALYHLSLAQFNKSKIARVSGVVKGLMTVAKGEDRQLRRVALRVMAGIVECKEGKTAMLDGGAVEGAVALLKGAAAEEGEEEEMVVRMLYGMSGGGLRFRGMARRAGAEEVLEKAAKGRMGDMAMMALQAIRGEEEREREVARILGLAATDESEDWSGASVTEVALRRLNRDAGVGSGPVSAGF